MTKWGYIHAGGAKVEYVYTDNPAAVEQLAATAPKETWDVFYVEQIPTKEYPHPYRKTKSCSMIRAVREMGNSAGYFWNGWYATHEQVANVLRFGRYHMNSFVYVIGQMNEGFAEKVKNFLEEL